MSEDGSRYPRPMHLDELQTPCALVDLHRFEANCAAMADKASRLGVRLRPHVKTHKTIEGARIQIRGHFGGITVSTMAEARALAAAGFHDITYAVPVAPQRLPEIMELNGHGHRVAVLVDHLATFRAVNDIAASSSMRLPTWLKLDCGLHRSGVDPGSEGAVELARRLARSPHVDFRGVLTHAGQSYRAASPREAAEIALLEVASCRRFVARLADAAIEIPRISVGSTPTMAAVTDLDGVDEIRPGNYVFFDAFQAAIGSCAVDDIAFSVLATVISAFPSHQRAVIDAGALALSKDPGPTHVAPDCGFGLMVDAEDQRPLPGLRLTSLSQEHGMVEGPGAATLQPGDRVRVLPNHSCLAAACFDRLIIVRADRAIAEWHPVRGW
jgi:D-serine deaminase-like pyridoxal phosphate-dependent protein